MNKRRVFVYDPTRGFSRFLRVKYRDGYDFNICNNPKRFQELFVSKYDISFIVINTNDDLLNFAYMYENSKYIFVGSTHDEFNEMLNKFKRVILLDLKLKKTDVLSLINVNLNVIKFDLAKKE